MHLQVFIKVEKLQNRAAGVVTYSNYKSKAGCLFELLGWRNLSCQQQMQRPNLVCKSLHGLAPEYLYLSYLLIT